ncbi:MAG: glycosyltransferase family 1 protein [Acidobacteria bacterium]|nr:glycosyltransferase family 1 protein [Acidobacteriota bacterium]
MRIGIDARELMGRPTGVGRYLGELLHAWADPQLGLPGRHEFLLYTPERLRPAILQQAAALRPCERIVPGDGRTWWEQSALARAAGADHLDVFFAPAYTAPLRLRAPVVVTIHDLSFAAHPEWFRWREGVRRRLVTRWSGRSAATVLTDSQFSAGEIVRHVGVPPASIRVILLGVTPPAGVSAADRRLDGGSARTIEPAGRGPLVLYVGSVFNRRRVPDLIRAFAKVARSRADARLAIIGENRTYPYEDLAAVCRNEGVMDAVQLRAYVTDQELADAYRDASVFVFLSEYEGFGLTPLEALASGIPAVVLDTPVAREVCGEAAWYVERGNIHQTAEAIGELIADAGTRTRYLDAASRILRRYSWIDAARQTMAALESAAR